MDDLWREGSDAAARARLAGRRGPWSNSQNPGILDEVTRTGGWLVAGGWWLVAGGITILSPVARRPSPTSMNLLVIRHAIAEDKERFAASGRSDDQRPLTEEGRTKMRRGAEGVRLVSPRVTILASSPLVRARETAEIVAPALKIARAEIVDALRPDRPFEELLAWLGKRVPPPNENEDDTTVAIIGHEPHLSGLVTWLMTGEKDSRLELKKGGACLLSFERTPAAGEATMRWLLTPGQLRDLSGR